MIVIFTMVLENELLYGLVVQTVRFLRCNALLTEFHKQLQAQNFQQKLLN